MNDLRKFVRTANTATLTSAARAAKPEEYRDIITWSKKVFIPLTELCRDSCHYCTFAKSPRIVKAPFLSPDKVMEIALSGKKAGCKEALFTLGDRPETRYAAARDALAHLGFGSTIDYLHDIASRVLRESGLLPHINAGVMTFAELEKLKPVSASMGLMLESTSERLCEKGGPHFGSPDKHPQVRLKTIADAGRAQIPFTTGLLIGIGESVDERIDTLFAIQELHQRYGHIQEVIIQNFKPKPGTKMAASPEPSQEELIRTVAMARLILNQDIAVQSPPNLNPGRISALIDAGLDDWGGISPVTIDHVNPQHEWPQIDLLARECASKGMTLTERLTLHPKYARDGHIWLAPSVRPYVLKQSDATGLARENSWSPGMSLKAPGTPGNPLGNPISETGQNLLIERTLSRLSCGKSVDADSIAHLFSARGPAARKIIKMADKLRQIHNGETVTYVINRNINYTNICLYSCSFCAFSKSSSKLGLRDKAYNLPLEEIASRTQEAWSKGATEVCLQGGIHPNYTGQTYIDILRAVKQAQPDMHVHAFSPLEVFQGARTLGLPTIDYLKILKAEGLGSLPGTAAEILDDDIRKVLCPDKLSTLEWLNTVRAAHQVGLRTTATIMFGSVEQPIHWARHLLHIRDLQLETGGFTEFVPLPFVHMSSPIYVKGLARKGPTWRETILMHAISRIVLSGAINSIQASWVKLGADGAAACLAAGANDLGGVLMNESISRAAGAAHGELLSERDIIHTATLARRTAQQRSTLYDSLC